MINKPIKIKNTLIVSIVFILLYSGNCFSQQNTEQKKINKIKLGLFDAFLIELSIDTVYENNLFDFKETNYKVCKVTVNKIYFMFDTSYVTREELMKARFLLLPDSIKTEVGDIHRVSVYASNGKKFFIFGRFLNENDINADQYYYHAIIMRYELRDKKLNKFIRKKSRE